MTTSSGGGRSCIGLTTRVDTTIREHARVVMDVGRILSKLSLRARLHLTIQSAAT
jgi:hypothetical protein